MRRLTRAPRRALAYGPLFGAGFGVLALLTGDRASTAPTLRPESATARPGHHHHHHHHHHDELAPAPTAPAPTAPAPSDAAGCPASTVRVEGSYCPRAVEECLAWAPDDTERCLEFRKLTRCDTRHRVAMRFCIDRYEWPNREGAAPEVLHSWNEAAQHCADVGRRLCTEDEWTFACEGPEMLPYPYGYVRDETACNIDHENMAFDHEAVTGPDRARAAAEAARVSQSVTSGSMARCVSPFGVHDMAGNVDEWTVSREGRRYRSTLKGGYWGRIRARCRPGTHSHDEGFRYYQIGFRCCADVAGG